MLLLHPYGTGTGTVEVLNERNCFRRGEDAVCDGREKVVVNWMLFHYFEILNSTIS
jgi:hypothetical protein